MISLWHSLPEPSKVDYYIADRGIGRTACLRPLLCTVSQLMFFCWCETACQSAEILSWSIDLLGLRNTALVSS